MSGGDVYKRQAQFHKVSFEQFKESWDDSFPGASEAVSYTHLDVYKRQG